MQTAACVEERYVAPGHFNEWAEHVTAELSANILSIPFGKKPEDAIPLELRNDILHLTPSLDREIRELRKQFTITTVDKAEQNLMLICTKHYIATCLADLERSDTYSLVDVNQEDFFNHRRDELQQNFGGKVYRKVPHYLLTVKLHKHPWAYRFIVSSFRADLTNVAKKVNGALGLFRLMLHMEWNETYHHTGPGLLYTMKL